MEPRCVRAFGVWPATASLTTCLQSNLFLILFFYWSFISFYVIGCSFYFNSTHCMQSGSTNWRGRLSTVDLLIKVACFVKEVYNIFNWKSSWSKLSIKGFLKIALIDTMMIPDKHKTVTTVLSRCHDDTGIFVRYPMLRMTHPSRHFFIFSLCSVFMHVCKAKSAGRALRVQRQYF